MICTFHLVGIVSGVTLETYDMLDMWIEYSRQWMRTKFW